MRFPAHGLKRDEILARMRAYRTGDQDIHSGRVWSYVYDAGPEVDAMGKQAYMEFLHESGLDPTAFPSLMRFEVELAAMAAAHVGGDEHVVGNFTSGGTESIMLAVKSARDRARKLHPEITAPEMVLPITAHAAFHKAAHYLGVKPVLTAVDSVTFLADVDDMRRAITPRTIMLVGSAPAYAHGGVDDITAIAALAAERGLWCHVDACMGGFLLPYFRRLGEDIPPFGFEVPGVTSLSMDLHKYGYTPKNASLVLYRNIDFRRYQIYACSNWTGYTIINNALQSSKTGGPLAAAWAVVNMLGDDGYLELARLKLDATKRIIAGVAAIDDIRILGKPQMSLVCFTSETVNVFHIIDEMKVRGWLLLPQLSFGNSPANVHLSVNANSHAVVDAMLADLREAVAAARLLPVSEIAGQIRDAFANVDPDAFDRDAFRAMLQMAGMDNIAVPERMAEINQVLDALPVPLRERLLAEFLNELFVAPTE